MAGDDARQVSPGSLPSGGIPAAASFEASLDQLANANLWMAERGEVLELSAKTAFALELCLEEIFVNVVIHGGAKQVHLTLTRGDGAVVLEIRDDGRAFDTVAATPHRVKDPLDSNQIGGLGIGLVKQFARSLYYHREKDMNCLTLEIALSAA